MTSQSKVGTHFSSEPTWYLILLSEGKKWALQRGSHHNRIMMRGVGGAKLPEHKWETWACDATTKVNVSKMAALMRLNKIFLF